jgi:hypothetical protein
MADGPETLDERRTDGRHVVDVNDPQRRDRLAEFAQVRSLHFGWPSEPALRSRVYG